MKQQQSRGRKNWLKLKNIILSGTLGTKRKDKKFKLFEKEIHHAQDHIITTYSHNAFFLQQRSPLPTYKQMLHFEGDVDSTGSWVWEAEEIAAYFFIECGHDIIAGLVAKEEVRALRILELGAGSSGLAGIALCQLAIHQFNGLQVQLCLTDGETSTIPFLADNLQLNLGEKCRSSGERLLWGGQSSTENLAKPDSQRRRYEIIVICDCLYFMDFHKQLLLTIDSFLSPLGAVYIIAPSRGQSISQFLKLAEGSSFSVQFIQFKNAEFQAEAATLRQSKDFLEDKHFPYFLRLSRNVI